MKEDYSTLMLLTHISSLVVSLPFIIGLIRRKYFKAPELIFLLLISASAITEIIIEFLRHYNINNMYVTHVYTIFEFMFISLFFVKTISPSRLNIILYSIMFLFLCLSVYELLSDPADTSDEMSTTAESICFIIYSLCTFYYMLQHPEQRSVFALPLFWLNTAILLYFSGNLFLFLFSNYLEAHSPLVYHELWGIHSVLNIVFYILISIGFWKTKAR